MRDLVDARVLLTGGGVVGLCLGIELLERGARVLLADPGTPGGNASLNASGVAAGMLAPAMESATDPLSRGRFPLLKAGRDLWPAMAGGTVPIHREGALWIALEAEAEPPFAGIASALKREGADHEPADPEMLRHAAPSLYGRPAIWTRDDWRLEPGPALRTLEAAFRSAGGETRTGRVRGIDQGGAWLGDGSRLEADRVAVTAGWGARALAEGVSELAVLSPIAGELARFPGAPPFGGPTVRTRDGYLVPGAHGVVVGATMAEGIDDAQVTPEGQARFRDLGRRVFPGLAGVAVEGAAGVRASTPDGLPLVGRAAGGVWLCTGFRRNGWLLAPLAARITADLMAGRDPGPWAAILRPSRFAPVSLGGR